jgi:tryptophan 7-halogenase
MNEHAIRDLVIVGGGTAGWMMAAAAARVLNNGQRRITLIESDAIGTVGVGEATIPTIQTFNQRLGIDEGEFLKATKGSFKLGIEFVNWRTLGQAYFHPFGTTGRDFDGIAFHQLWLWLRDMNGIGSFDDYSMCAVAARHGRFAHGNTDPRSPLSNITYAYHFDATLYAAFLREYAEAGGVQRIEGKITIVERDALTGNITTLHLEGERRVTGDLFIDCSGFRSLLLGETLGVSYNDWSHWLPCDRAIAVPSETRAPLHPFTRATAHDVGWQWRIPLQHRTGNGHVYASGFTSDDEAEAKLLDTLDTPATGTPRKLSFTTGVRERLWDHNVVALGLAGGFLEPLESTSIHLIQTGIAKLLALFPDRRIDAVERDEYNRLMRASYEGVRDFIIAHYHVTERDDTPFWNYVRTMPIPDTLTRRLALFGHKGRLFRYDDELFSTGSWVSVLTGQGLHPRECDPLVDTLDRLRLSDALRRIRGTHFALADQLPTHLAALEAIIAQNTN